jgi:acyl carrier protein
MSINERLLRVFRKAIDFDGDTIDGSEDLLSGSLALDSIDMLEIVLGVKKEFGIEIALDKGEDPIFKTFDQLIEVIEERTAEVA